MRNRILGGLAVAAMLLGGTAFASASPVAATQEGAQVCYEQTYGDVIQKQTSERTRDRIEGQHYSWTGGNLPTDQPPVGDIPPSDNWQANTHQEPHNFATWIGASGQGLHYTQASEQAASWFYFQPVSLSEWSDWTDWANWDSDPVNDDGRNRGPGPHGEQTDTYERQFRYVVVGEYVISTTEVDCPTQDDKVTYGDWIGEPPCGVSEYKQTRTVTTISYTWNVETESFDEVTVVSSQERTVEVEVQPCPTTSTTEPEVTTTTEPEVTTTTEPDETTTTEPPETTTTEPPETTEPPTETTEPPTETTQPPRAATPPTTAKTPPPTGQLPSTGSNGTTTGLMLASLAAGLGAALIALSRRKTV